MTDGTGTCLKRRNIMADIRRLIGMATRLVIDGNSVYEIDEECERMRQKYFVGKRQIERTQDCGQRRGKDETAPEIKGQP